MRSGYRPFQMTPHQQPVGPDQVIGVDACGPGEWIVGPAVSERMLHVYRIGPGDWLVSEVGRVNEGRGSDLRQALAALAAGALPPEWWELAAGLLDGGT
jgi:hypothetical protein